MTERVCLTCGFANPPEMGFCGGCGAALKNVCPECSFENPPGFKFCGRCGKSMEAAEAGKPASDSSSPSDKTTTESILESIAPQRRQLSVLFCDLVGSTQLSERIDPEELRDVVLAYQGVCAEVTERYAGHIAQYLGDGLLIYFGYPVAHEDDARRSVHVGLEMLRAIDGLSARFEPRIGCKLEARVGIHTGDVVIGEVGGGSTREHLALGPTPNVAARLQGVAEPGEVVISSVTEALVRGFFALESLGKKELKGAAEPLEVFRVGKESGVHSLFELSLYGELTGLVGRDAELGLITSSLERVKEGRGKVFLLTGEAGVGKSRLVHQLRQELSAESYVWRICRGSTFHQTSAFHPLIELLETILGLEEADSTDEKLDRLEERIRTWEMPIERTAPLVADLLSVPTGDRYPPLELTPQKRKEAILQLVLDLVEIAGREDPLILIFEDLHWFDPSTLELVGLLAEQSAQARALLLLTARPDFMPPWKFTSDQTRIVLDRLTAEGVRRMVSDLAGGKEVPEQVVQSIVDKTDGVPLFVEELTKMVLESDLLTEVDGAYQLAEPSAHESTIHMPQMLAIPSSLKDSLMARFDQVGEAKRTAQLASVLGREFSLELLEALVEDDKQQIESDLKRLVEGEFLYQRGVPPRVRFIFKHALVQETTYGSLLKRDRGEIHRRAGLALEEHFPEVAANMPEVVAHHFERGEVPESAVLYWRRAGERSANAWAHAEAASNFGRALEQLEKLPAGRERKQTELEIRLAIGVGQIVTKGYAADEVRATYLRAQGLSEQLGDTPMPVRYGIWAVHLMRSDLEATQRLADWYESFADSNSEPVPKMMAEACLATRAFCRGEFDRAEVFADRTMALWSPDEHEAVALEYGGCGGFYGHLMTTWILAMTGRLDRALRHFQEIVALAEGLNAPYTLATALSFGVVVGQARREPEVVTEAAERMLAISEQHDFPWIALVGKIGLGWCAARSDDPEEGLRLLREGLAAFQASGTRLYYPYYVSFLVERLLDLGRSAEALEALDEVIDLSRRNVDRFYLPELLRLRGEALLSESAGSASQAEALFREACRLANELGALTQEIRAATSLGRLLKAGGSDEAAKEVVEAVYRRVDEGLATADLETAGALLSELGEARSEAGQSQ